MRDVTMTAPGQKTKLMDWLLLLVGPASWVLTIMIAAIVGTGPDAGWVAMAALFKGMGLILLIHTVAFAVLIVLAIRRYLQTRTVGKVVVTALSYYGLVTLIALVASGPTELLRDSQVVLRALFRR